jgi:hypothetical protein
MFSVSEARKIHTHRGDLIRSLHHTSVTSTVLLEIFESAVARFRKHHREKLLSRQTNELGLKFDLAPKITFSMLGAVSTEYRKGLFRKNMRMLRKVGAIQ